jgi:hypothetical protein
VRLRDVELEALIRVVAAELRRLPAPDEPLLSVARKLLAAAERRGYPRRFIAELHDAIRSSEP